MLSCIEHEKSFITRGLILVFTRMHNLFCWLCQALKYFPAICENVVCMHFGSLYCKHIRPRSDCSIVRSVCFKTKDILECILIYGADVMSRRLFQDKYIGRIRVNIYTCLYIRVSGEFLIASSTDKHCRN